MKQEAEGLVRKVKVAMASPHLDSGASDYSN